MHVFCIDRKISMSLGFSDLPVVNKEDDIFEVSNYVNALSAFIK